jgi:hypothetical protein
MPSRWHGGQRRAQTQGIRSGEPADGIAGAPVGAPRQDLREQRIARHAGIGNQAHLRERLAEM